MSTQLHIHTNSRPVSVLCKTYNESEPSEFHTIRLTAGEHQTDSVVMFFQNTQEFINFLNDLRTTCENKIWDLTAMPSEYEYDYAREPF